MRLEPLGDRALLLTLDDATRTPAVADAIRAAHLPGVVDVVPAFDRIAVHFQSYHGRPAHEPGHGRDARDTRARLRDLVESTASHATVDVRSIEIETRYDGPDLHELAASLKLSPDELIARHGGTTYTVLAVGFTPGFAYLGGLPAELHAPRRATPRPRVDPGSVAIGGPYTGVYPSATPGGWHLIGRVDVALFDLSRDEPSLLRVGDRVRFRSLSPVPGGEGWGEGVATRSSQATNERAEHAASASHAPSRRVTSESLPPHPRPLPRVRGRGSVTIASPGTHTTIQDLGRPGHRAAGVPVGGAVDPLAHVVANWLVGNDASAATLECALVGPRLRFARDAVVAVCGARVAGVPFARPFRVARGDELNLERFERGAYASLAIAGGFDGPLVLGSRATDARLGIGRALRTDDALSVAAKVPPLGLRNGWRAAVDAWYDADAPIRFIRSSEGIDLTSATFVVSARSDRMGVRLGATPRLAPPIDATRPSGPVTVGTIQMPPDGDPIVLLADAQTIGGYAIAGHVIAVDLTRLAQRRPGEGVQLQEVTLNEANALWQLRKRELARLRQAIVFHVA